MLLYAAFTMGLLGSMHCLGMCGPIAMALPVSTSNVWLKALKYLAYNLGRIITYAMLGCIAGLIGRGFVFAGLQQGISIFAGFSIVLSALAFYYPMNNKGFSRFVWPFYNQVKQAFIHYFQHSRVSDLLVLGLLNGLLPCGMIYAALLGAIATGEVWHGIGFMIFFGLGTVPLMLSVSFLKNLIGYRIKETFRIMSPIVALCLGLLLILRGLAIDIPHHIPFTSEKTHYKCK